MKQLVKKVSNTATTKNEEANNMNNLEVLKAFASRTQKEINSIDPKQLKTTEKHIMELKKKEAKNIDKTLTIKINIRIGWIESILEAKENELLNEIAGEDPKNEIAVTTNVKPSKKLESVASPKKIVKNTNKKEDPKKATPEAPEAKKEVKQASTPEAPKEDLKKAENEAKKKANIKVLNTKDMPDMKPDSALYVELETEQIFQVIFINRELESVVLFNSDGVIEADSKKFDKGILFYYIGNKSYCFDIVKAYSK